MPFDTSDIHSIDPGSDDEGDRWNCTVVIFVVNGVAYSYCSDPTHNGQGGVPGPSRRNLST